jgi:SIS domain
MLTAKRVPFRGPTTNGRKLLSFARRGSAQAAMRCSANDSAGLVQRSDHKVSHIGLGDASYTQKDTECVRLPWFLMQSVTNRTRRALDATGEGLQPAVSAQRRGTGWGGSSPFVAESRLRKPSYAARRRRFASLVGKYWIERLARLPVEIDVASEYRYREAPVDDGGLTIVVSQSGETADTLARCAICLRRAFTKTSLQKKSTTAVVQLLIRLLLRKRNSAALRLWRWRTTQRFPAKARIKLD